MGSMILLDLPVAWRCCCGACTWSIAAILRAFGSDLRRFLGKALRNRFAAFARRISA